MEMIFGLTSFRTRTNFDFLMKKERLIMDNKIYELRSIIYGKFDSQTKFANELGWSKQRISKISSGKKEPTISETSKIAKALGIDISVIADIFVQYWANRKEAE